MLKKPLGRLVKSAAFIALVFTAPTHAGGGGGGMIVYDPTNWIENNISALKSIETVKQLIKDEILQTAWKKATEEIQWKKGGVVDGTDIGSMRQIFKEFESKLNNLYGSASSANKVISQAYQEYAASNLPWEEYYAREVKLNNHREGRTALAFERERKLLEDVNRQAQEVKVLQAKISQTVGHQQALELMNSHLNLMVAQNSMILEELAHQGSEKTYKQNEEDAKRDRVTEISNDQMDGAKETKRRLEAFVGN